MRGILSRSYGLSWDLRTAAERVQAALLHAQRAENGIRFELPDGYVSECQVALRSELVRAITTLQSVLELAELQE